MVWDMTAPTDAAAEAATTSTSWVASDDTFGARLALIRQKMGWNIAKAARECGLDGESWRLWEQAGREPSRLITICMAIATRTGCDYMWLVHGPSGAMLRQRSETTHWYLETILSPSETAGREGRVVHRDGRRNTQNRRSGRQNRRVRIATGTPPARASVN